jgi:hypothetical protein
VVVELDSGGFESERSNRGAEVWRPEGESETVRGFGMDVWRQEGELVRWSGLTVRERHRKRERRPEGERGGLRERERFEGNKIWVRVWVGFFF